jgi:hypothetical protein
MFYGRKTESINILDSLAQFRLKTHGIFRHLYRTLCFSRKNNKKMAISERTDLGAHVDLCAERYRALEQKLDNLEERMDKIEEHIIVIRTTLMAHNNASQNKDSSATEKAQGTIITIGTAFGVALLTGLITTIVHFIMK